MPSIHDVARKAQVSTATVSRSFRSPNLLSSETHMRVLEAARQLNYKPRATRAGTDLDKEEVDIEVAEVPQQAIGFQFFSDPQTDKQQTDSYYAPMLMGAQKEAACQGYNLLIHTTDWNSLDRDNPKMLTSRAVDGVILLGATGHPRALTAFRENMTHVVLLNEREANQDFECVVSDGFGGMYSATQHLLDLGHRRIGFFLAEAAVCTYQDRLHGYVSALVDAGIAPDPNLIIGGKFETTFESRESHLTNLLSAPNRPTAMLAATDEYAIHVLRTLRRVGLRAPEDISLIGFGDTPFSQHSDPPLTTIQVDKERMGRVAVQRLIARIQSPEDCVNYPIVNQVSVNLEVRQSCRAL